MNRKKRLQLWFVVSGDVVETADGADPAAGVDEELAQGKRQARDSA